MKKNSVDRFTTIVTYDFSFHKSITMHAVTDKESIKFKFHLGEFPFQWGIGTKEARFVIAENESCIFPLGNMHYIGRYEAGQRYRGIDVILQPERYGPVVECFRANSMIRNLLTGQLVCKKYKMTARVKELLCHIINCPFVGAAADLYIEGKTLELISLYFNEIVLKNDKKDAKIRLSQKDIRGLQRVKKMLDECFEEPPTIAELSKLVYINEYKLKAGFRELYGTPIYRYVIDRRMEEAKKLFEERPMKVKEVASLVGYTNISHFIEMFRKKFGVSPSKLC
nr:AraC family transcriptional regulator [Sporomusa acidovorans]